MCTTIKLFYFMIKTGNIIYKISVRNLTTNQSSSSFYSVFVSQCTFNSDPEAEHFHFLAYIYYIYRQKIYKAGNIFQCVWAYLFSSAFKVSLVDVGVGVVCLSTLVLIWRDISAFVIFDCKSHKIHDNWSFIKIEVVANDGCGDTCVGFILYACL